MKSFVAEMKAEHVGIGGLYFISTMIICAFILFATVRLSWDSQAIAMADNIAYITSINVAVNGYVDRAIVPAGNYTGNLPFNNHTYSPLDDFNQMIYAAGIASNPNSCDVCNVYFDGNQAVVQFGEFRTALNTYIRPHQQESVIEVD